MKRQTKSEATAAPPWDGESAVQDAMASADVSPVGIDRSARGGRWRRRAWIAGLAGLVLIVALWLTFQHKPGWYRPAWLDEAGLQRVRHEAAVMAEQMGDQLVRRRPFELTLRATMLNEWLAAAPQLWPESTPTWSDRASDPAVGFEMDGFRVGAVMASRGWRTVASTHWEVEVSSDKGHIRWVLKDVRGGSLSLPWGWIEALVGPHLDELNGAKSAKPGNSVGSWAAGIESLEDLRRGVEIPNHFEWPNGRRRFRLESIEFGRGEVRLRIEPL